MGSDITDEAEEEDTDITDEDLGASIETGPELQGNGKEFNGNLKPATGLAPSVITLEVVLLLLTDVLSINLLALN